MFNQPMQGEQIGSLKDKDMNRNCLLVMLFAMLYPIAVWSAMPIGYTFYTTTNGVRTAFTAISSNYQCAIGIAWNSTRRTSSSNPTELGAGIPTEYQGTFVIPSFLNDQAYSVKEIGYKAFYKCEGITSVSIPNSITYIDVNAFNGCTGLTEVTIPGSVGIIDGDAFGCCHNLKSVTLNEGTKTIEYNAFLACTSLSSIDIPASVTTIGSKAFGGAQLKHDDYGYGTYEGCDNLTKVVVHWDEPISISSETFSNAANCTLYVPKGKVETYANADVWKDFKSIKEYSPIIEFADTKVKEICIANWDTDGDGELSEAEAAAITSLNKVFRKSKIQTFDELKYFTGLTSIYSEAFEDCSSLTTITIPNNVKSLNLQAFSRCSSLKDISFPSSLETIGTEAFWNCTALIAFNIPNGIKTIASAAFSGCNGLTSISIPASVKDIGGTPFNGCSNLTSISVDINNETYESPVGSNAIIHKATNTLVAGCKSTIIPESVITIGNNAFLNCSLTSLIIPSNVTSIGSSAFSGSSLSSLTLSEGLKSIGEKSFYSCNNLSYVVLPNSLTTIGVSAFQGCTNLPSIIIPNNVTSVGGSAFYGCISLKSATIEGGTIGYQQFYGCKELESVVINEVTTISNNAFIGCTSLTSITIPKSVTTIGSAAFNDCTNLLLVVSENDNPTDINNYAFSGINQKAILQVPVGTKSKYEAINGWKNYFKEIVDDGNVPEVYTLTIKVEGLGTVNYDGTNIRNNSYSSYILGGQSAELSFNADDANGLESIIINNRDVTTYINNNLYSTGTIISNTVIEVKFEFPVLSDGQTFEESYSFAKFTFKIISANDKTCELAGAWCDEDDVDVIVPSSVNGYQVIGIGAYAFEDEDDMESITISPSITYIGNGAFDEGGTVSDVYISDLDAWCKISFANSYSAPSYGNIWLNGKKITDLVIPNSINSINNFAFYGLSCIQSVYIPEGVESIAVSAFSNSLSSVTVSATEPILIEESSFSNQSNVSLYVPLGSIDAYMAANYWKDFNIFEMVNKEKQTLDYTSIPTMTYGNAAYTLPQKTAEGLTLTWSVDNGAAASISRNTLIIVGAGMATVTASQAGNDDYKPFSREFTLTVTKAALTITADDKTKSVGDENPELTVTYSGFVNGDDATTLTTQPTVTTTATKDSPEGTYPIIASGAASGNYDITYVDGTLTVVNAFAQANAISCADISARYGQKVSLPITMANDEDLNIVGISFTLTLPQGVAIDLDEDNSPVFELASSRLSPKQFSVYTNQYADGSWGFRILTNNATAKLNGTEGEMMSITLKVADDMEPGTYNILLTENKLSVRTEDNNVVTKAIHDATSSIEVLDVEMGDVNGDSVVDLSDAIMVTYYSLHIAPANFIAAAADMNGDGDIDLSDAIIIIYKSLGVVESRRQNAIIPD